MSGLYPSSPCPDMFISRFRAVPKNHQPNKCCLITDLAHSTGSSANYGITPTLCSLAYVSIDDPILKILQSGKGTMLATIDIQSAFYLLPLHPEDRHLQTISWKGEVYIDHCIPFGLRSAPKLINTLADLLLLAHKKLEYHILSIIWMIT